MNNLLLFTVITIQTMCASCRDRARFSATQLPTASSCKERAHYADYVSYIHTYIHMHLQRQSRQFERAHAAPRSHLPCIFPHAHFPCFPLHTALRISSANQRSGKNSDAHAASEAGSRESGVGTRSVARLGRAAPCGSLLRLTWRLVRLVGLLGGLEAWGTDEVVMDGDWVFWVLWYVGSWI